MKITGLDQDQIHDMFQGPESSVLDREVRGVQAVHFGFETDSAVRGARGARRQEAQRIVIARVMSSVEVIFDAPGECTGARHPIALGAIAHES